MTEKEQQQVFEDWLRQHKGLIFKIVRAYTSTVMEQDDLFQEIIIQVWHSVPKFRQVSSVGTWLYRIALNTAIKWMTKERKHHHADMPEHMQYLLTENKVPLDERLSWLYDEIHALDEIDRSITLL
ncbi:MAG TPA: RNA polymerase sigma factor, partial [Chitinophagaceae bacterium]